MPPVRSKIAALSRQNSDSFALKLRALCADQRGLAGRRRLQRLSRRPQRRRRRPQHSLLHAQTPPCARVGCALESDARLSLRIDLCSLSSTDPVVQLRLLVTVDSRRRRTHETAQASTSAP
eukprot:1348444-Pleurochrysis_carterae.AAC.1